MVDVQTCYCTIQNVFLYAVDSIYFVALTMGRILANKGPAYLTDGLLFRNSHRWPRLRTRAQFSSQYLVTTPCTHGLFSDGQKSVRIEYCFSGRQRIEHTRLTFGNGGRHRRT